MSKPLSHLDYGERKKIEKMLRAGYSNAMMGLELDRGRNTLTTEVRRNGGKENYNAKHAQQRAELQQEIRRRKVAGIMKDKGINIYNVLRTEIKCMQMQIDILMDEIKKLKEQK